MFQDTVADTIEMDDIAQEQPRSTQSINADFSTLTPVDRLRTLARLVPGRVVFTTSFGLEDQAMTHLIAEAGISVDLITLDTGRLFPQTYDVWAETEVRYGLHVRAVYPRAEALEELIEDQGISGFRDSIANRKACCTVRKLEPLNRALKGAAAWMTGLRADQTANRGDMTFVSEDAERGLLKVNPLLDWSRERIAALIDEHAVPINILHSSGFPSIGCAPCTRAVKANEPERAGRWWWETDGSQECGLHVSANGHLVRAKAA